MDIYILECTKQKTTKDLYANIGPLLYNINNDIS